MEKVKEVRKIDDKNVSTRLLDKHYSPLCVRKYQYKGWPLFVGIICDQSLSDLDNIFYKAAEDYKYLLEKSDIQNCRDFVGSISEEIINFYNGIKEGSIEGVGIFYYVDKCAISSLYGDLMTHAQCRSEFYFIINTLPHI